jgi:hypothetical protein
MVQNWHKKITEEEQEVSACYCEMQSASKWGRSKQQPWTYGWYTSPCLALLGYWEWDCHWQGSSWGTQNFFSHPLSLLILISVLVAQILCGCWGFSCANASRNCATNYDICKMTTKVGMGNGHFLGSYVCLIAQALWAHLNENGDFLILMRVVIILMHNFTASTTPTNN